MLRSTLLELPKEQDQEISTRRKAKFVHEESMERKIKIDDMTKTREEIEKKGRVQC